MQNTPLLISNLLANAARHHSEAEIVSREYTQQIYKYTYRELEKRAKQLANFLESHNINKGQRVASIAWNNRRHLELYYGVSGSGRVLHTINPRMQIQQMQWIINDAEDQAVYFDQSFYSIIQQLVPMCPQVKYWVSLTDSISYITENDRDTILSYEEIMGLQSHDYTWPNISEDSAASLCYTSGTTGNPKGVLYSNRSTVLHAYAVSLPDSLNLSSRDRILPVVPMFHVNAWGLPYSAALVGSSLILPGDDLSGEALYNLMDEENVTLSAGVPTVWGNLLDHMAKLGTSPRSMNRTVIGGSACPPAMYDVFQDKYNVRVIHAWGMTETSPVGTVASLKQSQISLPEQAQKALLLKQGRIVSGLDMRIVDDDGKELPWDGNTYGNLEITGPWIIEKYFNNPSQILTEQNGKRWFPTGDVATITADGVMQVVDRTKDVIKSGGEWISSIQIENIAMSADAVEMAACVGVPDKKWGERPILLIVQKKNQIVDKNIIKKLLSNELAKWQIPDKIVLVESIPLGATGKMQKKKLREMILNKEITFS